MFPFDLPSLSRGFAELTSTVAPLGARAAERVSTALGQLLGCAVQVTGRALPGASGDGSGCARLLLELPALPGTAAVEVDAGLVAGLVDRWAGGDGGPRNATALTPIEGSALELLALVSLEALSELETVERAFSPRLARNRPPPASPLCVALELKIGEERGRGRLLLPPAAVRALRRQPALPEAIAQAQVVGSLRQGGTTLDPDELAALAIGDVLLLDPDPADHLDLPGGARVAGRIAGDSFHVEGIS